ncbi:glycerate kinase [Rothia halotolerans]|uniref:glycerate kinase n=1 Tax=Rothia halotolerans TaxID=405770 RepID=UPI00101C6F6B|nr:glycerate kinase [Rothia halotolerans]
MPHSTSRTPRIVVASDKFKGSLTAHEVGRSLAAGIRAAVPEAQVETIPVADGGEGTLEAAIAAGFERRSARVHGPTMEPVDADYALRGEEAFVEMATASGLDLLPGGERDALGATSYGTGELIAAALDAGAARVVLGVGGSASTDGGAGLLSALGLELYDAEGDPLPPGGGALERLDRVEAAGLDPRLARTEFVLASDVDNPLLGEHGAAAVFGPQKGASEQDVARLDAGLARFARLLGESLGIAERRLEDSHGAGAAGGVGYAALAGLGAHREAGIEVVLELVGLALGIAGADLVITGEGSLDEQSLHGKTPMGVLACAREAGIPVLAVCGRSLLDAERVREAGFTGLHALAELEPDPARSMSEAGPLLERVGARIGERLPELLDGADAR